MQRLLLSWSPLCPAPGFRVAGLLVALLLGVVLLPLPPGHAAPADPALQPLDDFEKVAGAVLVLAKDLDFVPRYKQLASTVAETHALDAMLAARLGPELAGLDAEQRKTLKNLLFKRLVATYAMAFDGRLGKDLQRGAITASGDGVQRVELRLEGEGDARTLRMDLGVEGGVPKIVSVQWSGAEDVATERAADAQAFGTGGFAALVEAWTARVPLPERPASTSRTPVEAVTTLQDALIGVMKQAGTLGYQGRYDRLAPIVDATHDLPKIARLSLNRNWKQLTSAQQARFVERFRVLSIARYAGRFDGYAGESFEIVGDEEGRGTQIVRSNLVKSNGEKIPFVFQLRTAKAGDPRILNITADGVSDLATKQAEYARIMSTGGFEALMVTVEEQIQKQQ